MKAKYIRALCIAVTGVLIFSFTAAGGSSEEVAANSNRRVRSGVSAEFDTGFVTERNDSVVAGVSLTMANALETATAVASVSETDNITTAAGQESEEEPQSVYGYTNIGIAVVDSGNLNVREAASTDAKMVGKMPNHAACEILGQEGDWYLISSGEVTGYVSADYLVTGDAAKALAEEIKQTVARSTTMTLNVRVEPNTDCSIITTMAEGEELEVVEVLEGWVKVNVDSDEGYVSADYVEVETVLPRAMTMTEVRYGVGVSDVRVALVDYACQFVGNPYVWGGTSLTKGADCSGFVLSVFANYGISLPHSSKAQANCGTKISTSEAQPGDLFFYGNGSSINHVAIYIGGGQVVHASSPKTGIRISNSNYRTPVKVVRILND